MSNLMSEIDELLDNKLRNASAEGVRLGLNASLNAVDFCLAQNTPGTAAHNELLRLRAIMGALTVEQVEG
jgi:hypothetical protein